MTRTRRVFAGALYGYANTALVTLVGLWLTPFLLGRLGAFELGLWLVVQQALGYLLLMDLGVLAVLPREVAFATGRAGGLRTGPEVTELAARARRLVLWQTPLVATAAALLWIGVADHGGLVGPAALLLFAFVVFFPARIFQALLTGLQDLAFVGRMNLAAWGVNTTITVLLVLRGFGLYALAVGWAAGLAVMAAGCWLRLGRRFPGTLAERRRRVPLESLKPYMGSAMWVSLSQVAQVLLSGTDLLVIAWFLGPVAVVPYACTAKLISVLAHQPQTIMQAAAPALSEVRAGESPARLDHATSALTQAMLLLTGAVACVVAAVNAAFVTWWVGPEYYGGFGLTLLLIAGLLLRHWNTTAVYALFTRGYDRHIPIVTLVDGVVTVAIAAAAVSAFGAPGAALGSIGGALLVSLPANLTVLSRDSGFPLWRQLSPVAPWLVRFLPMLAAAAVVGFVWQPSGLPGIAFFAAAVGTAYALIAGPMVFRQPLAAYLRPWAAWR